jgi:iron complex outermembrane receptor protein
MFSAAGIGLCPAVAAAQDSTTPSQSAAAVSAQADTGTDIVVTAQRRSERLINVPMSITATSGAELTRSGVSSTGDLGQITPGLVTPSVGLSFTPAIRGVTSVSTSPGDETNVSLYLDDVYIGASTAGLFEFKDIERIEVLKGPQGTLFGRNATGGAIRVVTRAPSFTPSAEVSADYGVNFNRVKAGGYATTGLTDKIAASVAVNYVHDDGYIKGVGPNVGKRFGKERSLSGRGKLLFNATDNFSVTLSADASDSKNSAIYAWMPRAANFRYKDTPGAVIGGDYQYSGGTAPIANVKTWGASLTADWELPNALTIRSISAIRDARGLYQTDSDRINLPIGGLRLTQNQRNESQEFILSTAADKLISFVGGLYYYHARAWNPYFNTYAGDAPTGTVTTSFTNNVHTNSYAGYGELTINATDKLHLTGGARYTIEKKDIDFRFLVRAAGLVSASDAHTWKSPTFRGVIRYDLTPDANVYFSASNGFKSGVFNAYAYPLVAVQPEKIMAYEAGAKAKFAGLTGSIAAFAYNYSNIQVQAQSQIGGVFVVTLTNAAKAQIRGVEASLEGNLNRHLSFNLGASALPTAKYSNYALAQVFVPQALGNVVVAPYNATGSRTIRSPKFQANARLNYTTELAHGKFDGSISYAYNDGFYFQPGNFSFQKAYSVVNGRIAWTEPSGRFTFSVTGENLTNARYSFYTTDSTAGTVDVLARPREVSFGIAAKF